MSLHAPSNDEKFFIYKLIDQLIDDYKIIIFFLVLATINIIYINNTNLLKEYKVTIPYTGVNEEFHLNIVTKVVAIKTLLELMNKDDNSNNNIFQNLHNIDTRKEFIKSEFEKFFIQKMFLLEILEEDFSKTEAQAKIQNFKLDVNDKNSTPIIAINGTSNISYDLQILDRTINKIGEKIVEQYNNKIKSKIDQTRANYNLRKNELNLQLNTLKQNFMLRQSMIISHLEEQKKIALEMNIETNNIVNNQKNIVGLGLIDRSSLYNSLFDSNETFSLDKDIYLRGHVYINNLIQIYMKRGIDDIEKFDPQFGVKKILVEALDTKISQYNEIVNSGIIEIKLNDLKVIDYNTQTSNITVPISNRLGLISFIIFMSYLLFSIIFVLFVRSYKNYRLANKNS